MLIRPIHLIIGIFCLLTQNMTAQKTQTMLQKENLKGKVKSVYITNGYTYVKVWFDTTGKIIRKEYQWDENNIIVWNNYMYDSEDCLLFFSAHNMADPTNKLEHTYTYNGNGEVVLYRSGYGAITYKYDEKGNRISEMSKNVEDEYIERIYNEKNQLMEAFSHNGPTYFNVWKTDSDGSEYEETEWTEPVKRKHTFFEYNEFGDVSLITLHTENGFTILNQTGVITYDRYDDAGNWLEQTLPTYLSFDYYFNVYETHLGGHLHGNQRVTRLIEYYE